MLDGARVLVMLLAAAMFTAPTVRYAEAAGRAPGPGRLSVEQRAEIRRLEALGYVAGSRVARGESGVLLHDAQRAFPGLNFFVSGHGPEALLTDMQGRVLHRWSKGFGELWPRRKGLLRDSTSPAHYFRRGYPQPNGDVIVIFEGLGIARLDYQSRVLWKSAVPAHHDLQVLPNGQVAVLTRRARVIPEVDAVRPTLEDFVSILGRAGKEKRRVSVLDAFLDSDYAWMIDHRAKRHGDILHTNSIALLDDRAAPRNPAFVPGRVLLSVRELDAIAVLDLEASKIVWALQGGFASQHDAQVVDDGQILLFDNSGLGLESRAMELDPSDGSVLWSYRGAEGKALYSDCCGTTRRLPNGNTLVTETTAGRSFESTRGGQVVWEFRNPFRIPVSETDATSLTSNLFDLIRLPADYGRSWLDDRQR